MENTDTSNPAAPPQSHLTSRAAESNDSQIDAAGQSGEPVAWLVTSKNGLVRVAWTDKPSDEQILIAEYDGDIIAPLYAGPLPTQPAEGGEACGHLTRSNWNDGAVTCHDCHATLKPTAALDMSIEARLADAEADVARLHKEKMDLWMQVHGVAEPAAVELDGEHVTAQTLSGFMAAHLAITGYPPSDQEIFDAGVRAGKARAASPQATATQPASGASND